MTEREIYEHIVKNNGKCGDGIHAGDCQKCFMNKITFVCINYAKKLELAKKWLKENQMFKVGNRVEVVGYDSTYPHGFGTIMGIDTHADVKFADVEYDNGKRASMYITRLKKVDSYTTKHIDNYPSWLLNIPRDEAVLCNVDGHDQDYISGYDSGVSSFIGENNNWIFAEPVIQSTEKQKLQEKLTSLKTEVDSLEETITNMK